MRICFVTDGELNTFDESCPTLDANVYAFCFTALGHVSYEKELRGETAYFEDVAILSKERKAVVVCGCYTDAKGVKRKSVVVADGGRVLGVSDRINCIDREEYHCGAGLKLYDTSAGKIGVIVAEDLYFPHIAQTLSEIGAELILCIFEEPTETVEEIVMRSHAFCFGVPVAVCAHGYAEIADISGALRFASPQSPTVYDLEREQEYHLVETRKRGFYKVKKKAY